MKCNIYSNIVGKEKKRKEEEEEEEIGATGQVSSRLFDY